MFRTSGPGTIDSPQEMSPVGKSYESPNTFPLDEV